MEKTGFDVVIEMFNKQKEKQKLQEEKKQKFLVELERTFDNSSWADIMYVVNKAAELNVQDDIVVDNIVEYVRENNKITFKQWKVLRCHIRDCDKKNKKYKYGNK